MKTTPSQVQRSSAPNNTSRRRTRPGLGLILPAAAALLAQLATAAWAANIAPAGAAIMGVNDAIDSDAGTPRFHFNVGRNINDGNLNTREDNWFGDSGGDGGQTVSFVGVIWPNTRYDAITSLKLTLATFTDGGWFGVTGIGPGAGGTLFGLDLIEPTIQVTTDGGTTWTDVAATSDYYTALEGHGIGGGANPNPTSVATTFSPTPALSAVNGVRIIGENGGLAGADANGFIGVFELEIEASPPADTDSDGMPDAWERLHGLEVGVNDGDEDSDNDGLTNLEEFTADTKPEEADTDGDGLNDGAEVKTHQTDPLRTDSDGDGLADGAEVTTHQTDPTRADTDGDGLNDGEEVTITRTNPRARDTDADGFSDGLEVSEGTDPKNPASYPSNAALTGSAILGVNNAIDTDAGTTRFNAGVLASINDGNAATRVDNWFGGNADPVSFVGVTWPAPLATVVKSLTLTLATFTDGGWFGPAGVGPGAGGFLDGFLLLEPTVQVSTDGGTSWTSVAATSDYVSALDGHSIGGGGNPNPTSVTAQFTLATPAASINGIRIIGENGGFAGADDNGFIGVFELVVTAGLANDSDNDGMDDAWEANHGLMVGTHDAAEDPDDDDASNIQEFAANTDPQDPDTDDDDLTDGAELAQHGTNPNVADTDGDGLNDGVEVNTSRTNPLVVDSDSDTLSDGDEVNTHGTDPNQADTDGDGYDDAMEIAQNSDPRSAVSVPSNVALGGTGILGTKVAVDSGVETPVFNAGTAANINDGDRTTRVDTWNSGGTDTASFVGILWDAPVSRDIVRLEFSLAVFFDGGWFGVNFDGPGTGGMLSAPYLVEPMVQVSKDQGATWMTVAHRSDYLQVLEGHPLPTVDFGPPTTTIATFELTTPQTGIDGVRLIGSEGGTASGGFLGVFELEVHASPGPAPGVTLEHAALVGGQVQFEFQSVAGVTHAVEYKDSLGTAGWQPHSTITGDGTRKTVTDAPGQAQRFYQVTNQ